MDFTRVIAGLGSFLLGINFRGDTGVGWAAAIRAGEKTGFSNLATSFIVRRLPYGVASGDGFSGVSASDRARGERIWHVSFCPRLQPPFGVASSAVILGTTMLVLVSLGAVGREPC